MQTLITANRLVSDDLSRQVDRKDLDARNYLWCCACPMHATHDV